MPGIIDDMWPTVIAHGKLGLKFVGEIGYLDSNGITRWMGFMREYDPVAERFYISDDPDHEYAD